MMSFKQYLTEMRMTNPLSTLERHGEVKEKVDNRSIEIVLDATIPREMKDGTVLDFPADSTWIRVGRFGSDKPFELKSIQVADQLRGGATIALALVKRARELADEPIVLSDVRSPSGKRLAKAVERLGWTETKDGREWIK